jgi:hypothetical protein
VLIGISEHAQLRRRFVPVELSYNARAAPHFQGHAGIEMPGNAHRVGIISGCEIFPPNNLSGIVEGVGMKIAHRNGSRCGEFTAGIFNFNA